MHPKFANGSHDCECRCEKQHECNAFVFSPSTKLCFLIRIDLGNGTDLQNCSRKPATDRVFGLVRAPASLSQQVDGFQSRNFDFHAIAEGFQFASVLSNLIARDMQCRACWLTLSLLPFIYGFARVSSHTPQLLHYVVAIDERILRSLGLLLFVIGIHDIEFASLLASIVILAFFCALWLLWRSASASSRPRIAMMDDRHSNLPYRANNTPRDDIGWAGPTNYPVPGAVSPMAKGVVTEPLTVGEQHGDDNGDDARISANGTPPQCRRVCSMLRIVVCMLFALVFMFSVTSYFLSAFCVVIMVIGLNSIGAFKICSWFASFDNSNLPAHAQSVTTIDCDLFAPSGHSVQEQLIYETTPPPRTSSSSCISDDLLSPPRVRRELTGASLRCSLAYDADGNIIAHQKTVEESSSFT